MHAFSTLYFLWMQQYLTAKDPTQVTDPALTVLNNQSHTHRSGCVGNRGHGSKPVNII